MTFSPNVVMIPRYLVDDFATGELSDEDFAAGVADALGLRKVQSNPAPAPQERPSNPDPRSSNPVVPSGDFAAWFIDECRQRFPNLKPVTVSDVEMLLTQADGSEDALRDVIETTEEYANKQKIMSLVGLMKSQLGWGDFEKLRSRADGWRQRRDKDENSITSQAMRQTEAVLERTPVPSRSLNRIRDLQAVIEKRREESGIPTT